MLEEPGAQAIGKTASAARAAACFRDNEIIGVLSKGRRGRVDAIEMDGREETLKLYGRLDRVGSSGPR
jgi:hypothetical protein